MIEFIQNSSKEEIKTLLQKISNTKNIVFNSNLKSSNASLYQLQLDDKVLNQIKTLILQNCLSAECFTPNIIPIILSILKLSINDNLLNRIELALQNGGSLPTQSDIEWLMDEFLDYDQKDYVNKALQFAGFTGRIFVTSTEHQQPIIHRNDGYVFNLAFFEIYQNLKLKNVRVILYDGFIENVSEIHSILEKLYDAKEYLILFHRGASNDVINTVMQNWYRGSLKLISIQVPYDLCGINTLSDLSVICNSDVISSLNGQLLNCVKYEHIKCVDEIHLQTNKVAVKNSSTILNVELHRKQLFDKRENSIEDVQKLIDERIRSLTSSMITLKIPNTIDYVLKKQKVDQFLRAYKALVQYGTIIIDDKKMLTTTAIGILKFLPKIINQLNDLNVIIQC